MTQGKGTYGKQVGRPPTKKLRSGFKMRGWSAFKQDFPTRPLRAGEGKPGQGGITSTGIKLVKSIGEGVKKIFSKK